MGCICTKTYDDKNIRCPDCSKQQLGLSSEKGFKVIDLSYDENNKKVIVKKYKCTKGHIFYITEKYDYL